MLDRPSRALVATALLAVGLAVPRVAGQNHVNTELVVSGLDAPLFVTQPRQENQKFFVVEQSGIIKIVENGTILPTPFLDISAQVSLEPQAGLVGFVFHPSYMDTGYFYVHYKNHASEVVLERYVVPDPPSYVPDLGSGTVFLSQVTDHVGSGLDFGPDGKLYVAIGDERAILGNCNAQSGLSLQGKLLRLNDDGTSPADNPFVGDPNVLDSIYAMGLRQPWRLSIDDYTGNIFIGDVGGALWEEINVVPFGVGGLNFGWKVLEGHICIDSLGCTLPCPDPTVGYQRPVYQYDHSDGCCVIGGYVYRGTLIPELRGRYLFADFCSNRVWAFSLQAGAAQDLTELTAELQPSSGPALAGINSFGTDSRGELYIVSGGYGIPGQGKIFRIIREGFVSGSGGVAGTYGAPELTGESTLAGGDPLTVQLTGAADSAPAFLAYGLSELNAPFAGGTMVPDFGPPSGGLAFLTTDPNGAFTIQTTWPFHVPTGTTLVLQFWIADGAAPFGLSASNAITGASL